MGSSFRCRCGLVLKDFTDQHYLVVPWEVLYTTDGGDPIRQSENVFRCPACGRLVWEGENGFEYFQRNDSYPRVWADMSDRDRLGRVRLRHPRSIDEIERQLLRKPLCVTLYDDNGNEYDGEAFDGINDDNDELNPHEWAVILRDGRATV